MGDRLALRIRHVKVALSARGPVCRGLVPLAEVFEVWLTDGLAVVLQRVRIRLVRPATVPPRAYRDTLTSVPSVLRMPRVSHERPRLSIVIPMRDRMSLTWNCLASVIEHTPAGTYEVVIVDNGSSPEVRRALDSIADLRVIRNESNAGFVIACNQGASAAQGEFVLFLNNDTVVLPGWSEALVATLDRDPSVAAVGAKLLYPDGRLQEAGAIIWADGSGWNYGRGEDPDAPAFSFVREVDYCSGACLLVRREAFEQLGGFDTLYSPAYYEDSDLCFRMRERGQRVVYQPQARVVHLEGATAGTDLSTGFKKFQDVNRSKFVQRHAGALAAQCPPDPSLLYRARDRRGGRRILVVDHMVPHHDQDSGSVRMAEILRILTELGHRVTFLPDNLARIEPYAGEFQQLGIEVLYGPLSPVTYVEQNAATFDIVILCRAHFAIKYLSAVLGANPRPFLIFDTVDLHHLREQRLAELDGATSSARRAARTRAIELAVMHASDMVWVTSTYESEVLRAYEASLPVEVIPNIHHVRQSIPGFAERRDLLFIGSFRHPPNEDAVRYLVDEILPLVKERLPDVRLRVVGPYAPASLVALASRDVEILGFVQDVVPVFDSCRVSVAPLRYGAGVKGKVSQSLAWGVPVVTTPVGAEGMRLAHGEDVMVASTPRDFARHIIELHQNEAQWTRLSENGRRLAGAHLSHAAVRHALGRLIRRIEAGAPHVATGAGS